MPSSYLVQFQAMADRLAAHPHIRLLTFRTFEPASLADFAAVEQQLGHSLSPEIRAFYAETNGLQLRWIADTNAFFTQLQPTAALPWDFALQRLQPEEGAIFLLPLSLVFVPSPSPFRLMDAFSSVCAMYFCLDGTPNPPLLMSDDGGQSFSDSYRTDFNSYLQLLLAHKGYAPARPQCYRSGSGAMLHTPAKYWTKENSLDLDRWLFEHKFSRSAQPAAASAVQTLAMQQAAFKKMPFPEEQWKAIQAAHLDFLRSGGSGGTWTVLCLRGVSVGMYGGVEAKIGKQALLDMAHIPEEWDLQEIQMPFSSWCGAYIRHQDFSGANLEGTLWADALLEKTIFADANLQNADFSRANLRGASFMNADLRGADFENANLTGADFRGARLEGATFAGATLKGIIY